MPKKKILFQLNELGLGGTTKYVQILCEYIDKEKFDLYLFYKDDQKTFKYLRRKLAAKFSQKEKQRFEFHYKENLLRLPYFEELLGKDHIFCGGFSELKKAVVKIKPDILHLNRGDKVDFYTEKINKLPADLKIVETSIFGEAANQKYLDRIKQFYFISQFLMDKAPWHQNKGIVVYTPIFKAKAVSNLRSKLVIPKDAFVLGRIIRPGSDTGEFVINAFNKIQDGNSYLVYLGASDLVKAEATKNKFIKLLPPLNEMELSEFYNTLDVLLHWRKQGETFGMNIAEAFMHSKPAVSHVSFFNNAHVEVLDPNEFGECGYVAKQDDLDDYVKGIRRYQSNRELRITAGQNGFKKANSLYEASIIAKRFEFLYLEL